MSWLHLDRTDCSIYNVLLKLIETMKKNNFYRKMGILFAVVLGTSMASLAQITQMMPCENFIMDGSIRFSESVSGDSLYRIFRLSEPDKPAFWRFDGNFQALPTPFGSYEAIVPINFQGIVNITIAEQGNCRQNIIQYPIDLTPITDYDKRGVLLIGSNGVNDLIQINNGVCSISSAYKADSIIWCFSRLEETDFLRYSDISIYNDPSKIPSIKRLPKGQFYLNTKDSSFTITENVVVTAYVFSNNTWYWQRKTIEGIDDSLKIDTLGSIYNPYKANDLIIRLQDSLSFSVTQNFDEIVWNYYGMNGKDTTTLVSSSSSIDIRYYADAVIRVDVYIKGKGWFTDSARYKAMTYTSKDGGKLQLPYLPNAIYQWYRDGKLIIDSTNSSLRLNGGYGYYTGKMYWNNGDSAIYSYPVSQSFIESKNLILIDGLNRFVNYKFNSFPIDSLVWIYSGINDGTVFISNDASIEVQGDAFITIYVLSNGLWYAQTEIFKGLVYDSTESGTLSAPDVANATYTWYYNDKILSGITTSSYIPKDTGTYKVVVEWTISSANTLTEAGGIFNSATFTFKVTTLPIVTGLSNNQNVSKSVSVYPNPANQFAQLNTSGSFEYKMEDLNGTQVISGIGYNTTELDLGNVKAGVYLVYVKTNGTQLVKRLIVR
jgi:hypothetical protein